MEDNSLFNERTQWARVIHYLQAFGSISPLEAFRDLGITKLATRISEMTELGFEFGKQREDAKNRYNENVTYMRYTLISIPEKEKFVQLRFDFKEKRKGSNTND